MLHVCMVRGQGPACGLVLHVDYMYIRKIQQLAAAYSAAPITNLSALGLQGILVTKLYDIPHQMGCCQSVFIAFCFYAHNNSQNLAKN